MAETEALLDRDDRFMAEAIEAARCAGRAGDVPVGAVVVIEGEVISRGHNRRQVSADPTAHAEVEALRAASRVTGNWRIPGTLYVTQEPCPMCAGALVNARIERLVYGCPNPKAGAVRTLYELVTDVRLNHRMEVRGGVRAEECAALLREFFGDLRRRKSPPQPCPEGPAPESARESARESDDPPASVPAADDAE